MLNRIRSAAQYLKQATPVWTWRMSRARCRFCGSRWFLSLAPKPFMTRCLGCRNNVCNLSVVAAVQDLLGRIGRAYELSSYGATFDFLRRTAATFEFSEYFPGRPFGELVDGVRNEDVQQLTFPDESFDLVTSNAVFEHVVDDLAAFRECLRVLKPGGALFFTIPLHQAPTTVRLASRDATGAIVWHGSPEYHDSRIGGPGSAPVFWLHSESDICDRVQRVGFRRVQLHDVILTDAQRESQKVICAYK